MYTKVITVTPKFAEHCLANMVNNRQESIKHVSFLADAMRRGEWSVTGQPVIFTGSFNDKSRKLLDGQHRMRAVVVSGVTVQMLAVFGVDEAMFIKMDQGRNRSIADCLSVPNRNSVARAIRMIHAESKSGQGSQINTGNYRPSNAEVSRLIDMHSGLIECASFIAGKKNVRAMFGAGTATYCLYRTRKENPISSEAFFSRLNDGEGMSNRSPILGLRNYAILHKRGILDSRITIMMIAYAWYLYIDGKTGTVSENKATDAWFGWRSML